MISSSLEIKARDKKYEVVFIETPSVLINKINALDKAVVLIDEYVYKNYKFFIGAINREIAFFSISAQEESKTFSALELILNFFQLQKVTRGTPIVVIGGGVIQDVAFFAAHIYHRGLEVYFIPTTLLAMCDSCIGSKCALNFNGFKNQIGAFHAPKKVFIWAGFLDSLPSQALYSGYGEILKFVLIAGNQNFIELRDLFTSSSPQADSIGATIYQSLMVKKDFIERDEFDVGVRRLLNYGHTFGHALELITNYTIPHGIAVAYGMDIANYIAFNKGFIDEVYYAAIHHFIKAIFFSSEKYFIESQLLIKHTMQDKKNSHNELNMVFLKKPGDLFIQSLSFDKELDRIISNYIQENLA